jgi:hypothetical protein
VKSSPAPRSATIRFVILAPVAQVDRAAVS